jgi:hypothetical protein
MSKPLPQNKPITNKYNVHRTFVSTVGLFILILLLTGILSGCGIDKSIVGQWNMTKVLVGEKEYDASTFLDPTKQSDGSFIITFYEDKTLIATGSLGTNKGASDGTWQQLQENTYSLTIDNEKREVRLVGDLLFMDIEIDKSTLVVIFDRQPVK